MRLPITEAALEGGLDGGGLIPLRRLIVRRGSTSQDSAAVGKWHHGAPGACGISPDSCAVVGGDQHQTLGQYSVCKGVSGIAQAAMP